MRKTGVNYIHFSKKKIKVYEIMTDKNINMLLISHGCLIYCLKEDNIIMGILWL